MRNWIAGREARRPSSSDLPAEDRYADPGAPLTTLDARGHRVLRTADGGRTLSSIGAGPAEGNLGRSSTPSTSPATDLPARLAAPYFEVPVDLIDDGGKQLLQRRETVDDYYVRDLAGGKLPPVHFLYPTPQLAGIHKELIRYQRMACSSTAPAGSRRTACCRC